MAAIVDIRSTCKDLDVEFEVMPLVDIDNIVDERQRRIAEGIAAVDEQLTEVQSKIEKLNIDIDRLTNHADGLDYAIAVTSGIITGLIDVFIVGEWNFAEAKKETYQEVNSKVIEFAKQHPNYEPYCKTTLENLKKVPPKSVNPRKNPKDKNRLETAIEFLEFQYPLPGDGAYSSGKFGIDGKTHRLDDLCHHPTIVGLICCVIVQFTGHTKYINKHGEDINIPITVNDYGNFVGKNPVTKLFAGVINWFITCAKTIANRKGHLMSDIATPAGLPGSVLSIITELASIPCFRDADFLLRLRDAFTKGIGTGKGQIDLGAFNALFEGAQSKLDVVTEKAVMHELKRQAMPVIVNEMLVRGFYFIRRFIAELKEKQDIRCITWRNVIPINNRTIVRMLTIATGTFTAIDLADAAARAATKSADINTFCANMVLRVNFVGVGRFAVALSTDVGMGIARSVKRNQRMKLQSEQIMLLEAKIYYKQAGMWIAAENVAETLEEVYSMMEKTTEIFKESVEDIKDSLNNIGYLSSEINSKNAGLVNDILDILEWS